MEPHLSGVRRPPPPPRPPAPPTTAFGRGPFGERPRRQGATAIVPGAFVGSVVREMRLVVWAPRASWSWNAAVAVAFLVVAMAGLVAADALAGHTSLWLHGR